MRFQHGVEDSPTRAPISATESAAFSCRTARIFLSIVSMKLFFQLYGQKTIYREDYSRSSGPKAPQNQTGEKPFWAKNFSTSARVGAPAEPPSRLHLRPAAAAPKRIAATSL